jgi:hypothetical protein
MKAHEAISILEALDPQLEVTLTLSKRVNHIAYPQDPVQPVFFKDYVIGKEDWPKDTYPDRYKDLLGQRAH